MDVVFCEVEGFDSLVEEYFGSDDAYNRFQMALMANPTMGNVIRGTGRLRKARWSGRGHGRRGGLRVIYVNVPEYGRILLGRCVRQERGRRPDPRAAKHSGRARAGLCREPRTATDQTERRQVMSKQRPPLFERLKAGLEAAIEGRCKETTLSLPDPVRSYTPQDVMGIRARLRMTQAEFAILLNVSVKTIESWEQGLRPPSAAAARLLQVVERPEDFTRFLQQRMAS